MYVCVCVCVCVRVLSKNEIFISSTILSRKMTATTNTNSIPPVCKVPHICRSQEMQFFITDIEGVGGWGGPWGWCARQTNVQSLHHRLFLFVCLHCLLVWGDCSASWFPYPYVHEWVTIPTLQKYSPEMKLLGWPDSLFKFFIRWYRKAWMNFLAKAI